MDVVNNALALLERGLPNGAQSVLIDGQLGDSWRPVLEGLPKEVLEASEARSLLVQIRDRWLADGQPVPALSATQLLLATARRTLGDDHRDTLTEVAKLGLVFLQMSRGADGVLLLQTAWYSLNEQLSADDPLRVVVAGALGMALAAEGNASESRDFLAHALAVQRQIDPASAWLLAASLASVLESLDRGREAVALRKEAWLGAKNAGGAGDPTTLSLACALGDCLLAEDRAAEAVFALQEAVEYSEKLGDMGVNARASFTLGRVNLEFGQREAAARLVESAVRWTRDAGPAGMPHADLPDRLTLWASIELERGRQEVAEGVLREALEAERLLYGEDSVQVALRYAGLGALAVRTKRIDEAMGWLEVGISLLRSTVGDEDARTRNAVIVQLDLILHLAELAANRRNRAEHIDWLRRALAVAVPVLGPGDTRVLRIRESLSQ